MTNFTSDLEPFESPLLLVSKAKEDIINLETICESFLKSSGNSIIEQFDPKTCEMVLKIRFHERIPGTARILAYRIINDLRHALDQALCDGAFVLGATSVDNIHFPFGRDPADLAAQVKRYCKNIRTELVDFVLQFKPHYGGDDLLWALSRIAGPNKHQRILGIALDNDGMAILNGEIAPPCTMNINRWNDHRNELELIRVGQGGKAQMNFSLFLKIVIGSADIVGGQPAIAVLNQFASKVESIVSAIKAEVERLGRIK